MTPVRRYLGSRTAARKKRASDNGLAYNLVPSCFAAPLFNLGRSMSSQSAILGAKPPLTAAHGGGVRGAILPRRSPQFEGRFGRLFRTLPPAEFSIADLTLLAAENAMTAEAESQDGLPAAALEDPQTKFHDPEENTGIDAGYTYLGQFIDHDITFDPASSLQKGNDPDGLIDYRSPRLDLDCLYGRGPDDQPYMYTSDGRKFLLGTQLTENGHRSSARDLPRHEWQEDTKGQQDGGTRHFSRALIGDKRNDENVIVSQLQGAMLHFHNRLVDDLDLDFAEAQRMVRWHYQYVVLNDYLPRIVGKAMMDTILPPGDGSATLASGPHLKFYKFRDELFIPIEFSAAAYRYGHSMVRPIYRLNTHLDGGDDPKKATADEKKRGLAGRFFIFAGVARRGLNGFDKFPAQWAIDWSLFFDINGSAARVGKERVQPAYKIDPSLVNPLAFLPEFSLVTKASTEQLTLKKLQPAPRPNAIANLALRNLERGLFMSLPSGQDVARAMGERALTDDELFVGKAAYDEAFVKKSNKRLVDISANFAGKAPLWYYVLGEALAGWMAQVTATNSKGDAADRLPVTLGPVGGRIVAETLVGLVWGDSHSYLAQDPNWAPAIKFAGERLQMGDIIKYALRL